MMIESKTNNAELKWAQGSLECIVHKALEMYAKEYGIDYWGWYIIQFSKTDPDNSDKIILSRYEAYNIFETKEITKTALLQMLNFDKKVI